MCRPVILCVDDEDIVLHSLHTQLKHFFGSKYNIELAESAEEALVLVRNLITRNIDLPVIITDHIMPGMKGDEFLSNVYKLSHKTLNIMLTGQADSKAIGNAVNNAKLYRYIPKPWNSIDMNMTLKEALKSFSQEKTIEEQDRQLKASVIQLQKYNETLEEKVIERTIKINNQKNVLKENFENISVLNERLEDQNSAITASIIYAKRIQDAMLPTKEYVKELLPDNFLLYEPRDIVSGDFYWIKKIGKFIALAAADCTGHGVPGAIVSMLGIASLNEIIRENDVVSASQVLDELRKKIDLSLHQPGFKERTSDGMDIAFLIFDTETNVLQYSGAFNPLYLFRTNNGGQEFIEYRPDRMTVGHQTNPTGFTNHEIQLQKHDTLYVFSDGYCDQFGGQNQKKFTTRRFRKLINEIQSQSMQEQYITLKGALDKWKEDEPQVDDILVMGVRI